MDSESESILIIHYEKSQTTQNLQIDSDFLDSSRLQIRARICANVIVIQPFVTLSAVGCDTLLWLSLADQARLRRKSIATGKQPSMEIPPTAPPQPFRQSVSTQPTRPGSLSPSLSLSLPFAPLPLSPSTGLSSSQSQKRVSTPPLPRSLPLSQSVSLTLPPSVPLSHWAAGEWKVVGSNPGTGPSVATLPSLEVGYLTAELGLCCGFERPASSSEVLDKQLVMQEANMFICSLAND